MTPTVATEETSTSTAGADRIRPGGGAERGPGSLVLVLAALTALTRLPGLVAGRAFNTDEATLAVLGRTISGPGTIYVDAADHKPPLAFAAYGLVQRLTGSADLRYVRAFVAVLVLATALVVADEARRRWGRRAMWIGGVAVVLAAAALGPADAQAANFEMFTLLPIAVAVAAGARNRPWVAGAAVAVAALSKQPAAVTAIPVAVALWQTGRVRRVLAAGASGVGTIAVLVIPFGPGRVLEWALLRNDGYLKLDADGLAVAGTRLLAMFGLAVGFWCGAWLLLIGIGGWRWWRRRLARLGPDEVVGPDPDATGSEPMAGPGPVAAPDAAGRSHDETGTGGGAARGADLDLWLLLVGSAVATVPGLRFFPHYLIGLVPAVALLAAKGAMAGPPSSVRPDGRDPSPAWWRTRPNPLLLPAVAMTVIASVTAAALAWYQVSLPIPPPELAVSAYVRGHTEPGDTVLVWGNLPEVYWRADRYPAGALTHNNLLTGYSGRRARLTTDRDVADRGLYEDFVAGVRRDRPVLIVDGAASGARGGRYYPLAGYRLLQRYVDADYHQVATVEGAIIYRRVAPG